MARRTVGGPSPSQKSRLDGASKLFNSVIQPAASTSIPFDLSLGRCMRVASPNECALTGYGERGMRDRHVSHVCSATLKVFQVDQSERAMPLACGLSSHASW